MAERLQIGLVLGPSTGGIGRHVQTLARELGVRGHAVTVCAPASSAAIFDWAATGASFRPAPVGSVAPRDIARARRILRAAAPGWDVVHAHGMRAGVTAVLAGVTPVVVTWHNGPHDRWRRRWLHPLLERAVCRRADRILAVSADLAERARRSGAHDTRTVAVVAPPLPPATRTATDVRAELNVGAGPFLLAVARLEPQKRIDVLIDAVGGWPVRPAPATFVAGTGSLEVTLRRRAARLDARVTLLGRREDVADLLAAADIVVLPSAWEGYPLVAQEALRAGRALVATPVGGVPDLVGDAARLVPPGDPQALREALVELVADPAGRERLGAAGRARAAGWPTVANMVDELVENYLNLKSRVRSR